MSNALKDILKDCTVRHINATQLSDASGLDRKTVAAILSGDTADPRVETVSALARALGGELVYRTRDSAAAVTYEDVSYYRTLIANLTNELDSSSRWIRWLFFTCLGLVFMLVFEAGLMCCLHH